MKKEADGIAEEKKLKIAMLGHKRIPSREGGIEVVVEELSKRMVEKGYSVTCYNRKGSHVSGREFDGKNLNEYKGIKLKTAITINQKGLAAVTSSISATLSVALKKYDIVHFHAEGTCVMLWLPKLFGKRCIVTIHGLDWQRAKWGGFATTYIRFGEKIAVKYADEIIVLSKGLYDYFQQEYNRRTVFIPNGVNRPNIISVKIIEKKWGLKKNQFILFLGRLVPEKGIQYLIDAFKGVQTDKKLVIAGGSSDTNSFVKKLKAMSRGDDRILFTGFVQGQILDELYSNAYIYILPSDLEGMPLSLLEAMSYGNCCITADIAECVEVIEDKAVTFKRGDILDLKEKLQMLCNDKVLVERYKSQAADFICKKYNWDDVVRQTLKLYKEQ